jgi:hypothetical protein
MQFYQRQNLGTDKFNFFKANNRLLINFSKKLTNTITHNYSFSIQIPFFVCQFILQIM